MTHIQTTMAFQWAILKHRSSEKFRLQQGVSALSPTVTDVFTYLSHPCRLCITGASCDSPYFHASSQAGHSQSKWIFYELNSDHVTSLSKACIHSKLSVGPGSMACLASFFTNPSSPYFVTIFHAILTGLAMELFSVPTGGNWEAAHSESTIYILSSQKCHLPIRTTLCILKSSW